jgi:hypothetical protein
MAFYHFLKEYSQFLKNDLCRINNCNEQSIVTNNCTIVTNNCNKQSIVVFINFTETFLYFPYPFVTYY